MRLWHKDLIPVLPKRQLLSQWRECCAICSSIAKKRTPNHILVNKVLSSRGDFYAYTQRVLEEMSRRGYKVSTDSQERFDIHFNNTAFMFDENSTHFNIYPYWHNERYLRQCLYNLQEKYDCGGIPEDEWQTIESKFGEYLY